MQVALDSGVQKKWYIYIYIYINYLKYLLSKMLVHMENGNTTIFYSKVMFLKDFYIA